MPTNIGTAVLTLTTDGQQFFGGLDTAERRISGLGGSMQALGSRMSSFGSAWTVGVSAPIIGAGVAVINFATNMNASMANVATLIPGNSARVNELKTSVQELAIETGKSTGDLADGLYQVISAFGDTAESADVLRINAMAAAAGLATTTDAINLTSAVTKGYGDQNLEAVQHVSDLAFQAVRLGQTSFPELAASIGRVTPLTAALGVSQEELFGVMATGTGVTGGAAEVSTQLRGVLQALMSPTEAMSGLLGEMGLESGKALLEQQGLQGAIETIIGAAEASGEPLARYIGSIEGQTLAMALAGPQAGTFTEKLAAMNDVVGATEEAFIEQTQGVNAAGFAWEQFKQEMVVAAQRMGDVVLPVVMDAATAMRPLFDRVMDLVSSFRNLSPETQTMIVAIAGIAAVIGPVLVVVGTLISSIGAIIPVVTAVAGYIGTFVAFLGGPVILAIAAVVAAWYFWDEITAIVSGVYEAVKTWLVDKFLQAKDTISRTIDAVKELWLGLKTRVTELVTGIRDAVVDFLVTRFIAVKDQISGQLTAVAGLWQSFKESVIQIATDVYNGVKAWLLDRFTAVVDGIRDKISAVTGFFRDMYQEVVGGSIVPDMMGGIDAEFARLQSIMVAPTAATTEVVKASFMDALASVTGTLQTLGTVIGGRFQEFASNAHQLATSFRNTFTGITNITSQFSNGFQATAGALVMNIGSITGAVSLGISAVQGLIGLFTGPSAVEMFNNAARLGELTEQQIARFNVLTEAWEQLQAAHEAAGGLGDVGSSPEKQERETGRSSLRIPILDNPLGSLVTGPTLAGLAINGRPEFVLPASDFGGMLSVQQSMLGELGSLRRDLTTVIPSLVESASRHGAQTAGRRR